ncbi:hypothetical protein FQN57_003738 [Myotisia sp. PD_48]|nr:hypothetical protein FQN57_003738 [Myotisia sp. PD_48]
MAPRLRSSSRTASRNNTRPSSPLNAPTRPSSSTSEAARPKKQRKTGRDTRAPVDVVEEPERLRERKTSSTHQMETVVEQPELAAEQRAEASSSSRDEAQTDAPQANPETWEEPPLKSHSTFRLDGLRLAPVVGSNLPLEAGPGSRPRRGVMACLGSPPVRVTKKKGGKATKSKKKATKKGGEPPITASTSAEDPAISDSSRAEGIIQGVIERDEEPLVRITRSKAGGDKPDGDVASSQPAGPSVPLSRKYTTEKLMEILRSAISRAEESKDSKVADGLRWIKESSDSDPFLLSVLEGALNRPAGAQGRSAFQSLMRDAIKRVQNQQDGTSAATEMARTGSAATMSSLSTAKSLEAEAFVPATVEEDSANVPVPAKGKAVKAAKLKGNGKGRAGPSKSLAPPPASRKRKLQANPEFSEEDIAVKRLALDEATITGPSAVDESHTRTPMEPPRGFVFPAPRGPRQGSELFELDPSVAGTTRSKGKAPQKPTGSSANKRVRKPRVQADEIDNIDFCRACSGNGQLLCCDGCVDSFHFTCLEPPMDPNSPPEGRWFCPSCEKQGLLGGLAEVMETIPQTNFLLPEEVRGFFKGVGTGDNGEYKEVVDRPLGKGRVRTTRSGPGAEEHDVAANLRVRDSKGNLITCVQCGKTSENRRPIIACDFCPSTWHLDCVDPPLANPPHQVQGSDKAYHYWKCPNHIEHDLEMINPRGRVRRPRNPKYVDIEVLVAESDSESDSEADEGVVYRVPDHVVVHDFITQVKKERAEREAELAALQDQSRAPCDAEAAAIAVPKFTELGPTEQQAVMSLMAIMGRSGVERAELVVSQLIAGASEMFLNATSEIDVLRSLRELVGQRLASLVPSSTTSS